MEGREIKTLTQLTVQRHEIAQRLARLDSEYRTEHDKLAADLHEVDGWLGLAEKGIDLARAQAGQQIVSHSGQCDTDERRKVVQDAIDELAIWNGRKLKKYGLATVTYPGIADHRADYLLDCGPMSGRIAFEVELLSHVRDRDLTPDEIEAAIYYLTLIKGGQVG